MLVMLRTVGGVCIWAETILTEGAPQLTEELPNTFAIIPFMCVLQNVFGFFVVKLSRLIVGCCASGNLRVLLNHSCGELKKMLLSPLP